MNSTGAIEDIGGISSVVKAPAVGLAVTKSGRTTGNTIGSISSYSTTVSVRYPKSLRFGRGHALHLYESGGNQQQHVQRGRRLGVAYCFQ